MTLLRRLENLALFLVAIFAYWMLGESWWLFAILILAPDLSFAGYLAGPKLGAICYNAMHTWIAPVLCAALSLLMDWPIGPAVATIWFAHIAGDRALGYGLKYATGFKDTHLGTIGN